MNSVLRVTEFGIQLPDLSLLPAMQPSMRIPFPDGNPGLSSLNLLKPIHLSNLSRLRKILIRIYFPQKTYLQINHHICMYQTNTSRMMMIMTIFMRIQIHHHSNNWQILTDHVL